ncbi:MAG: transposase family protein [Deltaproteobacteria bacterium]|nr:transposase family protein [Deltaproteobacteria bacterium]
MLFSFYDHNVRRVRDLPCGDTRVYLEIPIRRVLCRRTLPRKCTPGTGDAARGPPVRPAAPSRGLPDDQGQEPEHHAVRDGRRVSAGLRAQPSALLWGLRTCARSPCRNCRAGLYCDT